MFIFEDIVEYQSEDSGCALFAQIGGEFDDTGMFIVLRSWDKHKDHLDARKLEGKKVRVTVEVIED